MADQKDSKYVMGNNLTEIERLRRQHAWVLRCTNGKIVHAPVDLQQPNLKILDVGCADGVLLEDLQRQVSSTAQLVGVDLTKEFLPETLSKNNITYAVGDLREPPVPERAAAFNLTNGRFLMAGVAPKTIDQGVQNLADTVAPGGWLQIQELDMSPDPSPQCRSWNDLMTVLAAMFDKVGLGANFANQLPEAFKRAGLENITVESHDLPAGRKAPDEKTVQDSLLPFKITIPSLRQASQGLGIELDPSVLDRLEERFEEEMLAEGAVSRMLVVYGQKPASK